MTKTLFEQPQVGWRGEAVFPHPLGAHEQKTRHGRRGHSDILDDALAPYRAWPQAVVQIATTKRNKDCRELQTEVKRMEG